MKLADITGDLVHGQQLAQQMAMMQRGFLRELATPMRKRQFPDMPADIVLNVADSIRNNLRAQRAIAFQLVFFPAANDEQLPPAIA